MLLFSTKRAPFTSTHQYDNPKSLCCTRILLIGIVVISVMLQCIWCTVFFRIVFMFGQMKKKNSKNSGILNIFYMFVMGGMPDKFSQLLIYISAAMITWNFTWMPTLWMMIWKSFQWSPTRAPLVYDSQIYNFWNLL